MKSKKIKIGDYVSVKGLKRTCGKVTHIKHDPDFTRFKVKDERTSLTKHWNEASLRKIKESTCLRKVKKKRN